VRAVDGMRYYVNKKKGSTWFSHWQGVSTQEKVFWIRRSLPGSDQIAHRFSPTSRWVPPLSLTNSTPLLDAVQPQFLRHNRSSWPNSTPLLDEHNRDPWPNRRPLTDEQHRSPWPNTTPLLSYFSASTTAAPDHCNSTPLFLDVHHRVPANSAPLLSHFQTEFREMIYIGRFVFFNYCNVLITNWLSWVLIKKSGSNWKDHFYCKAVNWKQLETPSPLCCKCDVVFSYIYTNNAKLVPVLHLSHIVRLQWF